jgi:hypothetical protein
VVPFSPAEFCTLFDAICGADIIPAAGYTADEATCELVYGGLTLSAERCRSAHLCNANLLGAATPHCYHAQGWGSPTSQVGPCM